MAGADGFEPTHARIKTWCLTAWRRPCRFKLNVPAIVRALKGYGRGGWIRTNASQDQNLVPYRLATPLYRTTRSWAFTSCALFASWRGNIQTLRTWSP